MTTLNKDIFDTCEIVEETENFALIYDPTISPFLIVGIRINQEVNFYNYYIIFKPLRKIEHATNSILGAKTTLQMSEDMYQTLLNPGKEPKPIIDENGVPVKLN